MLAKQIIRKVVKVYLIICFLFYYILLWMHPFVYLSNGW